jgi:hypothetical protein
MKNFIYKHYRKYYRLYFWFCAIRIWFYICIGNHKKAKAVVTERYEYSQKLLDEE